MSIETPSLYPSAVNTMPGPQTPPAADAFFSPIPRAVYDLRVQGRLQTRDVEVLGLLLDYKGRSTSRVTPRQDTLAARLRCSVDTVQRSLKRLAAAGLLAAVRLRDRTGRLGRCVYDLAATLGLMPRQAARLRSGQWGDETADPANPSRPNPPADARIEATPPAQTMPHGCGPQKADSDSVAEADNNAPAPPRTQDRPTGASTAHSPVVARLVALKMSERIALRLVALHGEDRCRHVLETLDTQKRVKNRAAWCYQCLTEGWGLEASPATRPSSQVRYRPLPAASPHSGTGTPDPLTVLPPAVAARLEAAARTVLIAELPLLRASLEAGRSRHLVAKRMRDLLAAGVGDGAESA